MLKQVTKEEFDVLKKYFNAEVRYFVDFPVKSNGSTHKTPATGKGVNRRVRLTTRAPILADGTIVKRVYDGVVKVLDKDPTRLIGRHDLVVQVRRTTNMKQTQIDPAISSLLEKGLLDYVSA